MYGLIVCVAFVALMTAIASWAHNARAPYVGELVESPVVNLVDFEIEDPQATSRAREEARNASPLIFAPEQAYLDRMRAAIEGLPRAVAESEEVQEVNPELVSEFGITKENLPLLHKYLLESGQPDPRWERWSSSFITLLWQRNPILSTQDFQAFATTLNKTVLLEQPTEGEQPLTRSLDDAVELGEGEETIANIKTELELLARRAGFPRDIAPVIAQRIGDNPQPTARLDKKLTQETATHAAAALPLVTHEHIRGEVIALPGEILDRNQVDRIDESHRAYRATTQAQAEWVLFTIGIAGMAIGLCALLAAYSVTFYPRISRNPLRLAVVLGLVLLATSGAVLLGVEIPSLIVLWMISTTLVVVIVIALAYDRRIALFGAIMQSLLIAIALEQGPGIITAQIVTSATMASMLREIRNRRALIRASTITAIVGACMFALPGLAQLSGSGGAWRSLLIDGASAFAAAYLVGFMMLGALPSLERIFNLTTGLTLSELRDPRHPLLRQMQQKALGTYNHSLQVANISEAAAEAIRADGLLVYVGALYHDVGKINKPEYFIENQAGGPNKHDKLSPAMSLLVITGHVKDGIELAREYSLPRVLIHFIESHHGTTLVEYFFHAARSKASEEGDKETVEEFEFRYPGPKPRTREAAILMLCDCIESALRTMSDPTPNRIEALVRSLSRKRLEDGQFDECPLSFRELRTVEDSIIKSLCAIYHSRIAYPNRQADAAENGNADAARSATA